MAAPNFQNYNLPLVSSPCNALSGRVPCGMTEFRQNHVEQYIPGGMDTRIVAELAGIELSTLHAWFSRGWIPGAGIGPRGRRRDIDFDLALRVLFVAELVRFGLSPQVAAIAAIPLQPSDKRRIVVTQHAAPGAPITTKEETIKTINAERKFYAQVLSGDFSSEDELTALLDKDFGDRRPSVYAVVNVEQLVEIVRQAELAWEQSRGGAR